MKNTMLFVWCFGMVLALSGCCHTSRVTCSGSNLTFDHDVVYAFHKVISTDSGDTTGTNKVSETWELKDCSQNRGALGLRIKPGQKIQWRSTSAFSIAVTNNAVWAITDPWKWETSPPSPFTNSTDGVVAALQNGAQWTVLLQCTATDNISFKYYVLNWSPPAASTEEDAEKIHKRATVSSQYRAIPPQDFMIEATILWDAGTAIGQGQ